MRHDGNIMLVLRFSSSLNLILLPFVRFCLRLKSMVEESNNSFSKLEAKRKEAEMVEEQKKEVFSRFPVLPSLSFVTFMSSSPPNACVG